jgi:penicillin-binding protein 1A
MGKYYTNEVTSNVTYRDISKHVVNALIATEDERFYEHSGIDAKSLFRAVAKLGHGGEVPLHNSSLKTCLTRALKILYAGLLRK